jgi:hypothetical protein
MDPSIAGVVIFGQKLAQERSEILQERIKNKTESDERNRKKRKKC